MSIGRGGLGAMMSRPATAQEYSNGGNGPDGRGPAVLAPVEAYGVHPPGVDPADADRRCSRLRQQYVPYYAPLSPVGSTGRWAPWVTFRCCPITPLITRVTLRIASLIRDRSRMGATDGERARTRCSAAKRAGDDSAHL